MSKKTPDGPLQDNANDTPDSALGKGDPLIQPSKTGLIPRLRSNFFAGVVITAPIGITVAIILWFLNGPLKNADRFVRNWLPDGGTNLEKYLQAIPLFGVIVAIFGLIILGALTRNFIGGAIIKAWENVVDSVPIVRSLYRFFKNVFETALQQSDRSFKEVAMVQYPQNGLWAIAFVVGDARGEMNEILADQGDNIVSIFVPTVPNPTSGFLIFVERSSLRILDMSVEDAAKVVFSMGLVVPEVKSPELAVSKLEELAREAQEKQSPNPPKKNKIFSNSKKTS